MQGIILKRAAFREHDLLVSILCDTKGNIEAVVRGGQKFKSKMAAHAEPLNLVYFDTIEGKKLSYIHSIFSLKCFCNIKENLEHLDIAMQAIFFISKIIKPSIKSPKALYLLIELLTILDNISQTQKLNIQSMFNIFLLKLHSIEGLIPQKNDYSDFCLQYKINTYVNTFNELLIIISKYNLIYLANLNLDKEKNNLLNNLNTYFWKN